MRVRPRESLEFRNNPVRGEGVERFAQEIGCLRVATQEIDEVCGDGSHAA
jgi:hypothetical protein